MVILINSVCKVDVCRCTLVILMMTLNYSREIDKPTAALEKSAFILELFFFGGGGGGEKIFKNFFFWGGGGVLTLTRAFFFPKKKKK